MEQLTILISPEGQWLLPGTPDFFTALGDPDPDYDAVGFAVKNLGFIKFQVIRQSIVEIELHPRHVELPALLAAQQQLLSSDVRLFRIRYFDTSWHSEVASSVECTIARLSELCASQFVPASYERFLVEPQDFGRLFEDEDNNLHDMAQKWRVSFGHFDPNIVPLAIRNGLLPRLAIIGVKPRRQDPVWRFIGDRHRWMGDNYPQTGLGSKVADIPDKDYGEWATGFYREVAESGRPRYDLISTSIQFRNEPGKPWRPIRYERLLLPWKTPSDEVFVTMCSKSAVSAAASQSTARAATATSAVPAAAVKPAADWRNDSADNSVARKLAISS